MVRAKPIFKATRVQGVQYSCSCGWRSSMWLGKGAPRSAAGELEAHRNKNPETHIWPASDGQAWFDQKKESCNAASV